MITNKRSLKRIATQINHSMLPRVFENPLVTWLIEFTVEPELILTLYIVFHLDTIIKRFILWRCFEKQQLGLPSSILSWETWITSTVCICSLRKVTYAPKQKWDPPLLSPLSFNSFVLKAMNELLWWSRCWRKLSTVDGSCIPWTEVALWPVNRSSLVFYPSPLSKSHIISMKLRNSRGKKWNVCMT